MLIPQEGISPLALAFGCARLGAIAVAVNTRYRAGEVEDIVGRTGAKALVMWPGFRGIDFPEILARVDPTALAALETVIVYSEDEAAPDVEIEGKRTVDCAAVLAAAPLDDDRAEADLGTNIFTTSGTTRALPEAVKHSHRAVVTVCIAALYGTGVRPGDRFMCPSSPAWGHGLWHGTIAPLALGVSNRRLCRQVRRPAPAARP